MRELGQRPVLGRRLVSVGLVGAPLVALLAGCDDDVVDLPGLPPVGPDPDEPLLKAAANAEIDMLDRVLGARRHRSLTSLVTSARRIHNAHVMLLVDAAGDDGERLIVTSPRGVKATPRAALEDLARRERRLAADHVDRAMKARSGPFARVLTVLAAAATQQSVVLSQAAAELAPGRS